MPSPNLYKCGINGTEFIVHIPNDSKCLIKKLIRYDITLTPTKDTSYIAALKYHSNQELEEIYKNLKKTTSLYMFDDFFRLAKEVEAGLPIIHITEYDLFSENCDLKFIPRFVKFLDSSIWHQYISLFEFDKSNNIVHNRVKRLMFKSLKRITCDYSTRSKFAISREVSEFNNRLLNNSYIINQGHGQYVAPYLFHSEQKAQQDINIIKSKNTQLLNSHNIKFRILLLDDHANIEMRPYIEDPESGLKEEYKARAKATNDTTQSHILNDKSKLKIIIDNIKQVLPKAQVVWSCPTDAQLIKIFNSNKDSKEIVHIDWNNTRGNIVSNSEEFDIGISCVRNIESAEVMLRYARYDIILLDYLLDNKKDSIFIDDCSKKEKSEYKVGREYSYELLKSINDNRNKYVDIEKEKINNEYIPAGPMNKLYFMHISAFSTAIAERLQEQGLIYNTKFWHIGKGACPTNTPKLFLFYFLSLMERRYNDMLFDEEYNIEGHTLIDLLRLLFKDGHKHVKQYSTKYFNALLSLRSKYDKMKHDTYPKEFEDKENWLDRRGSLLVYSLFPDIQHYSNSFWEHIQHLVYLFANGTMRQWPDMYEEYIFIRERLIEAEKELKVTSEKEKPSFLIEQYIIHLKNA